MDRFVLCSEFWAGEKGDQDEGTVGRFHVNIDVNICEGEEDWMGCAIASHY